MQKAGTKGKSGQRAFYKASISLLDSALTLACLLLWYEIVERFKIHRDTANIRFNKLVSHLEK
jgi:hypothetical protein